MMQYSDKASKIRKWVGDVNLPTEREHSVTGINSCSVRWTLGKRNGENALNVVVKEYDGQVLIHLRHCFKAAGEDRWYPMKKGVTLNSAQWDTFNQSFLNIDCEVRCLHCNN